MISDNGRRSIRTNRSNTSSACVSDVWNFRAIEEADSERSLKARTINISAALVIRRFLFTKRNSSFDSNLQSGFVHRHRRCFRIKNSSNPSWRTGWEMLRFLMPRECMRNPHWGQKWADGLVSRVIVFRIPSTFISDMRISESSKSKSCVILFMCPPFKGEVCKHILEKEEKKGNRRSDALLFAQKKGLTLKSDPKTSP